MSGNRIRRRVWTIAALVLLLMIVRVDFWWWGADMPPVLFGTFNLPMLYNLVIFLAGWALVVYTANTDTAEGGQR
jgi:hypothetical protein